MRDQAGHYTVLDMVRRRGSVHEVETMIAETARADGRRVAIGLPEDPGQAGKSQVSYLARQLAGYRIITSRETGSKATRAIPVACQMGAGNITLVRANWNDAFVEELRDFPFSGKDDQVDALSRAFDMLTPIGTSARVASVPFLER